MQQRTRQPESLALAGREALHEVVGPIGHAEAAEQFVDPALGGMGVEAPDLGCEHEVLASRQPVVETGVFGQHAGAGPEVVPLTDRIEPEDRGRAAVWVEHAVEQPHRGGLPGAVGTEQGEHLAGLGIDRQAIDGRSRREVPGQLVGSDDSHVCPIVRGLVQDATVIARAATPAARPAEHRLMGAGP